MLEISIEINGEFANKVLQDSLEKRLNEVFETAGLKEDVQSLLDSGQDMSPEAVAGRIVDFAVSFLDAFKGNHQDSESMVQLDNFVSLIKGAVEQGFAEAGDILKGIGEIGGEAQADIDETFDLTMSKIDVFAEEQEQSLIEAVTLQGEQAEEGASVL